VTDVVRMGTLVGMKTADEVVRCARVLNEFGTVIYFDRDPNLSDFVVLDPRWLTNGMNIHALNV
jgi:hypothetical protein